MCPLKAFLLAVDRLAWLIEVPSIKNFDIIHEARLLISSKRSTIVRLGRDGPGDRFSPSLAERERIPDQLRDVGDAQSL